RMTGAIFCDTRPAMIIRSDCRGEPRNTSDPNRAMSHRDADTDIISMAQQASPKLMGQIELRRAQFTARSIVVNRNPWSARSGVSCPGRSSVTFGPSVSAISPFLQTDYLTPGIGKR